MAEHSSQAAGETEGGLGPLLRAHRARAMQSQEQLTERSGLSVRTIRNLEGGRIGRPYPDTIRRLADALNLTGEEREDFEGTARGDGRREGGAWPRRRPLVTIPGDSLPWCCWRARSSRSR
jgi:transcriptional regulator with XRE-family HTH domain